MRKKKYVSWPGTNSVANEKKLEVSESLLTLLSTAFLFLFPLSHRLFFKLNVRYKVLVLSLLNSRQYNAIQNSQNICSQKDISIRYFWNHSMRVYSP